MIYKTGDDLRQDQLVIQMFNLMDSLLKKVNLDLRLTPYRVLATSPSDGYVEFVANSRTLQDILEKNGFDIKRYLERCNPRVQDQERALDNFIKSSAGYCVTTYLLGVGDRHLENIMLTEDGHLFHIDFGFILGSDPKFYTLPPMKIRREMVECMGGTQSKGYQLFRSNCCLAFNHLRKHANTIINLLCLMVDANIPNLASAPEKNILDVQDKFKLELTDEEAEHYILGVVDASIGALMSVFNDKVHSIASMFK